MIPVFFLNLNHSRDEISELGIHSSTRNLFQYSPNILLEFESETESYNFEICSKSDSGIDSSPGRGPSIGSTD